MITLILFIGIFAAAAAILGAKCIELKSRVGEIPAYKREFAQSKSDNNFLRLQNGELNDTIDETRADIAALREKNRSASLKNAEMSLELQKANRKIYELERRLKMEKVGLKELM